MHLPWRMSYKSLKSLSQSSIRIGLSSWIVFQTVASSISNEVMKVALRGKQNSTNKENESYRIVRKYDQQNRSIEKGETTENIRTNQKRNKRYKKSPKTWRCRETKEVGVSRILYICYKTSTILQNWLLISPTAFCSVISFHVEKCTLGHICK